MVFLGGAVLANIVCHFFYISLSDAADHIQMADKDDMWISKQEWQEQGPRILSKLGPRT